MKLLDRLKQKKQESTSMFDCWFLSQKIVETKLTQRMKAHYDKLKKESKQKLDKNV